MGLAGRAQGARRRRWGDIVDDEQRSDRPADPMRPSGSGGARTSAALALLDDVTPSPASRRLASAPAPPGTRPLLILGRAPSVHSIDAHRPLRSHSVVARSREELRRDRVFGAARHPADRHLYGARSCASYPLITFADVAVSTSLEAVLQCDLHVSS
jgi:hypothetical protein